MSKKQGNKDKYYSSILSAIIGTVASHPLDTLKTNQQISGKKLYDVIKSFNNSKKDIIKNYYRGIKYPLLFIPIEKGIVFNINSYLYSKVNNHMISGLGAGLTAGFFVNFIENLKINQQNIYNTKESIVNKNTFTKGLKHTLLREGLGYTIYFKTYNDYYKNILPVFFAGGLSGVTAWVVIYPFDKIKTLTQSGITVKNVDIKNLYHGCGLSLMRAFIMHGIVFYLMDKINNIK